MIQLKLVHCSQDYWEFVRNLRNDTRVQNGFIHSINITKSMQYEYMSKYSKYYRICIFNGNPCGYVGVIDDDIRICTHPDFQGEGIGKFMIKEIMIEEPKAYAKVKTDNYTSIKLFESCGFTKKFYILTKD